MKKKHLIIAFLVGFLISILETIVKMTIKKKGNEQNTNTL